MRSRVATKSAVLVLAILGTVGAFALGAQAGATLNGRVMAISVAHVPIIAPPPAAPAPAR